jgi:hypothetical protein
MYKIIIQTTICIFVSVGLFAQQSDNSKYDFDNKSTAVFFGVKAGANYSNVYNGNGPSFQHDPKFGFAGGAFLSVPITSLFGVQPEVLFSQKGYKATGMLLNEPYEITRTTNYLDVPILVSFRPLTFLSILAGPQYSFLLSQKNKVESGTFSSEQEIIFDNEEVRKSTLCFTGGFDVNVQHWVLGGRIGWDLFKNNGNDNETTPRYNNSWFQVTLGYRI